MGEEASVATWRRRWPGKTGRIGRGSPSRSGTGCHDTPSPPAARARFDFLPPAVGEMGGSGSRAGERTGDGARWIVELDRLLTVRSPVGGREVAAKRFDTQGVLAAGSEGNVDLLDFY